MEEGKQLLNECENELRSVPGQKPLMGASFSPQPRDLVGRADTPPPALHRTLRGSEGFQGGQNSSQSQPLSLTGLASYQAHWPQLPNS